MLGRKFRYDLVVLEKGVYKEGPVRESNPGPLAPKARIMPLDQQARRITHCLETGNDGARAG